MAYSCVEVWFEIGHEASVRTKRTPEGFTHDWEVFVRGVDNADINYFVDKVVFHLHETFPKPKRVIKEPPYCLKESGYAGFNLPIDVYFKNKDEPKKVRYYYDLHLQNSGPPISNIKREKYTFSNPSEDFRRKLIRGGGVGVLGSEAGGNSVSTEKTSAEEGTPSVQPTVKHSTPTLAGKPKLTSDPSKKAKIKEGKSDEPKSSNQSFADLFGPPIKTAKVSPDPKKPSQSKVSPVSKNSKPVDKPDKINSDKQYTSSKPKHIPQKEIKKDKDGSSRDDKGERKDKSKERDRSKEKSSSKHQSPPPKLSKEEPKKSSSSEHKEKVESKSSEVKVEKERKKEKKAKDEKIKKEKHKDPEKFPSERPEKIEKHAKESKEKDVKKSPKHSSKEVEKVREKEKHKDTDKEKLKHRHKKREKEKYKKKEESREREKTKKVEEKENSSAGGDHHVEKRKRSESHSPSPSPEASPILPPSPEKEPERPAPVVKDKPSKHPLSTLFAELEDHMSDSSTSPLSGDEDVIELPKLKSKTFSPRETKPEPPPKEVPRVEEKQETVRPDPVEPPEMVVEEVKVSKHKQSSHRDKSSSGGSSSKSKSKEKSLKKKEREQVESVVEESKEVEKKKKKRSKRSREEAVPETTPVKETKEDDDEVPKMKIEKLNDIALKPPPDIAVVHKPKFSKEYLSELLDLQKKIMTIKDDGELQRVVQVLAQSGKYEMNSKSFDVDLCALDKSTVKKLQEFFTVS
ncbi:protein ENL isoform X1 [Ischnura elegans]|uniref:protein ENL isoform X1 n=1 Tax=Ischnura elegans TaxID=197161 RepID=UPI001ED894D7|nr:protein ENL isoform X1 [Ischnura elegans]